MGKLATDAVLDSLLDEIADNGDYLCLCSQEPADYDEAFTTYMLARVQLTTGDGNGDYAITDGDTSGRKLTVAQQSDIVSTNSGTATHAALVDSSGTRLLVVTTCTPQVITAPNTVTVPALPMEISDPV
jgi:hypothetical protein